MAYAAAGQTIKFGKSRKPYIVQAICDKRFSGEWVCSDCNEILGKQPSEGSHHNKHQLFFWCSGHGPEDGHAHAVSEEKLRNSSREAMRKVSKLFPDLF